jgi:hypothetical protein
MYTTDQKISVVNYCHSNYASNFIIIASKEPLEIRLHHEDKEKIVSMSGDVVIKCEY